MLFTEVLAVLSISAATGLRLALPLLLIGLLSGPELWSRVPLLNAIPPAIVLGLLAGWSAFELIMTKTRANYRFIQGIELLFSPVVGIIAGVAIARYVGMESWVLWFVSLISGLFALVIQLVQVGTAYRRRHGPPLWVLFSQDLICVVLVLLAFDAPEQGGLIAMLLLWLAIRTSTLWRKWYVEQTDALDRTQPRRHKHEPD